VKKYLGEDFDGRRRPIIEVLITNETPHRRLNQCDAEIGTGSL
jgi:hypothetical protein